MNRDVVKTTIIKSIGGTMTFPEVISTLLEEGVDSYHVDLVRSENRYYASTGESLVETVELPHGVAAETFAASGVEAAVRKIQAGKSSYREFIDEILAAGCVYYMACLSGRRVIYFGRKGDLHIEHFPSKK